MACLTVSTGRRSAVLWRRSGGGDRFVYGGGGAAAVCSGAVAVRVGTAAGGGRAGHLLRRSFLADVLGVLFF